MKKSDATAIKECTERMLFNSALIIFYSSLHFCHTLFKIRLPIKYIFINYMFRVGGGEIKEFILFKFGTKKLGCEEKIR